MQVERHMTGAVELSVTNMVTHMLVDIPKAHLAILTATQSIILVGLL